MKKCVITKYDESITEPPFEFITIGETEVYQPEDDDGGVAFARNLEEATRKEGYDFKFYSTTSEDYKGYDYQIVVFGSPEWEYGKKSDNELFFEAVLDNMLENQIPETHIFRIPFEGVFVVVGESKEHCKNKIEKYIEDNFKEEFQEQFKKDIEYVKVLTMDDPPIRIK